MEESHVGFWSTALARLRDSKPARWFSSLPLHLPVRLPECGAALCPVWISDLEKLRQQVCCFHGGKQIIYIYINQSMRVLPTSVELSVRHVGADPFKGRNKLFSVCCIKKEHRMRWVPLDLWSTHTIVKSCWYPADFGVMWKAAYFK